MVGMQHKGHEDSEQLPVTEEKVNVDGCQINKCFAGRPVVFE
jgi:hypothetical protein